MQDNTFFESVKNNLNGQPGRPIVLGVCKTLAARFNLEVWFVRLAGIILGVFFTFATLVAYILLGLFLDETAERSKSLFEGLGIWFHELTEKLACCCNGVFCGSSSRRSRYDR